MNTPRKFAIASAVGALIIAALMVLMLVGLFGLPSSDSNDGAQSQGGVSQQDYDAADVPARPDCPVGDVAGVQLPCLGGQVQPDPQAPAATVVTLWAWWCQPCRQELPVFDEFAAVHPEMRVLGVHADTNAAAGASLLDELGVQLPSLQDSSNSFAGTLGLPGVVPITVVVRPDGSFVPVAKVFDSVEQLEAVVQEAMHGAT